jgi:hypothetical protein
LILCDINFSQIPFVFATNDGGTPEHIKASILSQELGIPVSGAPNIFFFHQRNSILQS